MSQKILFLGQNVWKKFGKSLEKFGKVWKFRKLDFPNVWKFQKFRKFWKLLFSKLSEIYKKNDVKLELRKSRKTRSDSKTNSKVRLKVWNARPYHVGSQRIIFATISKLGRGIISILAN